MAKKFLIEKPALIETLKALKAQHFAAMETAAELRSNGKETEYSPRDYEMQAYAINSVIEQVAQIPAYNLAVEEEVEPSEEDTLEGKLAWDLWRARMLAQISDVQKARDIIHKTLEDWDQ